MLFLLRQIRRQLLMKNKFSTYLLYALGEILLVVVGILIAVQIDDWNQNEKNRKTERSILIGLLKEFLEAKEEMNTDIEFRNQIIRYSQYALDLRQDNQSMPADSIDALLANLLSYRFYTPSHPTLNDLINSGRMELIQSDSLRLCLQWYLQDKDRIKVFENQEREYVENYVEPLLSRNLDMSTAFTGNIDATDFNRLFLQKEFGSLLFNKIYKTDNVSYFGKILVESVDETLLNLRLALNQEMDSVNHLKK